MLASAILTTLSKKATKGNATLGKAKLILGNEIEVVDRILKSIMSVCTVELPQEVSVKISQQSEDLELTRRSQAGDN
jgi:hypothetical protein